MAAAAFIHLVDHVIEQHQRVLLRLSPKPLELGEPQGENRRSALSLGAECPKVPAIEKKLQVFPVRPQGG